MEKTILRRDVVDQLRSGAPFDMQYVTCNRKKGTGGQLITVEGWLKVDHSAEKKAAPGQGTNNGNEIPIAIGKETRSPNHEEHGTVNIFNPENAGIHPHKVHIDLILVFNGKRVIN